MKKVLFFVFCLSLMMLVSCEPTTATDSAITNSGIYISGDNNNLDIDIIIEAPEPVEEEEPEEVEIPEVGTPDIDLPDTDINNSIYGGGFDLSTSGASKDLEKHAALREERGIQRISTHYQEAFGLSIDVSNRNAGLIYEYLNTQNKRSLTANDVNTLVGGVLGTDYDALAGAIIDRMTGDESNYKSIIERAAEIQEVSPEHMQKIMEIFTN